MSVYIAFYKGTPKPGSPWRERLKYAFDWGIRIITRSPYSHCELAIPDEGRPGVYFCVASSVRDDAGTHGKRRSIFPWDRGGIRGKYMRLPAERWDVLPCALSAECVRLALAQYQGNRYDWLGVFRFVLPFLRESRQRWFCSEFAAHLLHLPEPHRHTPQSVYQSIVNSKENP